MVHFLALSFLISWCLRIFLAATRSSVVPGPNPVHEGSVLPLSTRDPLFLPGTDDEVERVDEEVVGTDGEDGGDLATLLPPPMGAADMDDEGYSFLQRRWLAASIKSPKFRSYLTRLLEILLNLT